MKLLIASDGSQFAHQAALFGERIASALDAELSLLGVAETTDQVVSLRDHLHYLNEELAPDLTLPMSVRHGQPADEILEEAETLGADILVIGIRGRRNVADLIIGDTARRLARRSPIPIVTVRRARPGIENILVCTAGGEHGAADTDLASRIALGSGARVTFLHVMSQVSMRPGSAADELRRHEGWHRRHATPEGVHLDELLDIATSQGVDATARIRHGLVVDEIRAEAEDGDYDLVIVGAHRQRGIWRWLLTDVTEQILTGVDRPILIVP